MSRRYFYHRMTAQQLAAALEQLGLTTDEFTYLAGISERKAVMMLEGTGEGSEIPHLIVVLLSLLTLPDALSVAFDVTDMVEQGIIKHRRIYKRMTPWEFHRAAQSVDLSKKDIVQLTGLNNQKIERMYSGETDVPHGVRVLFALLHLPDGLGIAWAVTNAMLIKEDQDNKSLGERMIQAVDEAHAMVSEDK